MHVLVAAELAVAAEMPATPRIDSCRRLWHIFVCTHGKCTVKSEKEILCTGARMSERVDSHQKIFRKACLQVISGRGRHT